MGGMNLGNGDSLGTNSNSVATAARELPAAGGTLAARPPWFRVL